MHELSVCQALLIQVTDIVRAQSAHAVECITIEVGPLCGTEPELLLSAFLAMRSGPASRAQLMIKRCPVRINCIDCGAQTETPPNRLICGYCGGWRIRVISGNELRLLRVEMRMPESIEQQKSTRTAEQIDYV